VSAHAIPKQGLGLTYSPQARGARPIRWPLTDGRLWGYDPVKDDRSDFTDFIYGLVILHRVVSPKRRQRQVALKRPRTGIPRSKENAPP
jgi:hypothetical protein